MKDLERSPIASSWLEEYSFFWESQVTVIWIDLHPMRIVYINWQFALSTRWINRVYWNKKQNKIKKMSRLDSITSQPDVCQFPRRRRRCFFSLNWIWKSSFSSVWEKRSRAWSVHLSDAIKIITQRLENNFYLTPNYRYIPIHICTTSEYVNFIH